MKVIFLAGSLNQGGAEFQLIALARLFQERGNEVEVFSLTDYLFYKPYLAEHKIRYSHLLNSQSKIRRLWLTARKFRQEKPDVVFAYLRVVGQIAIFARMLSFQSFKVFIGERTSLIIPGYDHYYFNLMRLATGITVNSVSKHRYVQARFPFLSSKTYFFPNIMDLSSFCPDPVQISDHVRISFVGRISPEKNVIELVRAVRLLMLDHVGIRLNIYGDTRNTSYMNAVEGEIANGAFKENIKIVGKSDNIAEVYQKTDLLCLISEFEGFSNVISEALCSGIPVVASDIEENRYLIEDGINGFLVNHKNIESIANGVLRYLRLPAHARIQMRRNNRIKAEGLFNNDKIYSDYVSVLTT